MFKNNKILILGMARSGEKAAYTLIKRDNEVILNDIKDESYHDAKTISDLKKLGVKFIFGMHPTDLLDNSFDYIIKNPGIRDDHPLIQKAYELNIPVINAYLLFLIDVSSFLLL